MLNASIHCDLNKHAWCNKEKDAVNEVFRLIMLRLHLSTELERLYVNKPHRPA